MEAAARPLRGPLMCGIAGVLGRLEPVEPMIEAIRHRGPNGVRVEQIAGGAVGHARLSIIDLEAAGSPCTPPARP